VAATTSSMSTAGAFQPDSTFDVRDVVLDFQRAGLPGGDLVRLFGDEFAWVGRIDANPRNGAVLPGGGDGFGRLVRAGWCAGLAMLGCRGAHQGSATR
jgi:hypothetical protein